MNFIKVDTSMHTCLYINTTISYKGKSETSIWYDNHIWDDVKNMED